jgi:enoyl-CoA hydratase/carnithine racemase
MGFDRALRMVGLSEVYDAETALGLGLVSEVVPDDELQSRAEELAAAFASRSPVALRVAKRLMRDALASSFEQSLSDAALAVMFVNTGADAQEGMRAFRERRAPRFEGR